jgi:hypothetical protein
VTTISLEMSLPGVLGFWLDERWGTGVLCTILGFAIGFSLGMFHLIKLAKSPPGGNSSGTDSSGTDSSGTEGSNQESD